MNAVRLSKMIAVAAVVGLTAGSLMAQDNNNNNQRRDRGNFDPAQFQQRMMDGVRERLAFTNDGDWKAVQPLVQKVFDARRDVGFGGGMGMRGGSSRRNSDTNAPAGGRDQSRRSFGEPSAEAQALQKAIESNAPAAQVKEALDKCRAARKQKEDALKQAQEQLRAVLTARQEAEAYSMGLVN
jgi:hypothetical protein